MSLPAIICWLFSSGTGSCFVRDNVIYVDNLYRVAICACAYCMINTWMMYHYIVTYMHTHTRVITVGLTSARPNFINKIPYMTNASHGVLDIIAGLMHGLGITMSKVMGTD